MRHWVRRPRSWRRDTSGSMIPEFALIVPLFSLLLFSFFEMGRAFWTYHIVSASVRDAARYAARLPLDCASLPSDPEWGSIRTLARTGATNGTKSLIAGWVNNDITVTPSCSGGMTYTKPDSTTVTFSGRYQGFTSIPKITVRAEAPFQPLFGQLVPGLPAMRITVTNEQVWTG
jgi:hypothetical protein